MSEPKLEKPTLPADEIENAYSGVTKLNARILRLTERRDALLDDIAHRIEGSTIPSEVMLMALALGYLTGKRAEERYERLVQIDQAIRANRGGPMAVVYRESKNLSTPNRGPWLQYLNIGRLASDAAVTITGRSEASTAVDAAVRIPIVRTGPPAMDDLLKQHEWMGSRLGEEVEDTDRKFLSLPGPRSLDNTFAVGKEQISQIFLNGLDPNFPNGTVLDRAFEQLKAA